MSETPNIYILHGDDDTAMQEVVAEIQSKLGDENVAAVNTIVLKAPELNLNSLRNAAMAIPFLASHRLVITLGASKVFSGEGTRKLFLDLLEQIPTSTKLVLIENPPLQEKRERIKNKAPKHWLHKWANFVGNRVFLHAYDLLEGAEMKGWIRDKANELGADMLPDAVAELERLVGSNKEAATLEIEKLLAHAAYSRSISRADVELVSAPIGDKGDFFALVDSITGGNGTHAMELLETLLEEQDHILLFFSLVSHFRLLLETKELLDTGRGDVDVPGELGIHPYRAEKLAAQARRFSIQTLTAIYQRLAELDFQIKTGEIKPNLAMETFVASLSA